MRHARIAPGAGPQLALAVEARLGEDEDRDRRGELEPLGRPLAPEQAPEDVAVARDDLAEDESEVDPEREPDDVEHDERRDRENAAGRRRGSARARARTDATLERLVRCDLAVGRRTRRLRRRSDLAGHPVDVRAEPRRPTRREARSRRTRAASASRSTTSRTARKDPEHSRGDSVRLAVERGPCRGSRRGRDRGSPRLASARARSPSECVVGIARQHRVPTGSSTTAGLASVAQRSPWPRGTEDAARAACSRRSRARRRPPRPRRPCTSRRRRRASARARAHVARVPPRSTRSPVPAPVGRA